jgi:hypothetical protein
VTATTSAKAFGASRRCQKAADFWEVVDSSKDYHTGWQCFEEESAGSVNDNGSTAVAGSSTGLEAAILEKLKVDSVSFGELDRIEGFRGKNAIMLGGCSNVVLWPAVSDEAAEILQRLHDAGHFRYQRSSAMPYFIDSSHLPSMPIAKRMRQYKKLHWLPVLLRIISKEEDRPPRLHRAHLRAAGVT